MAAITSAQSGLGSATSTWVGGVVPGIADTVTIAANHVVTVDGTVITGGDTAGGFVVRGTVKASRTVNSSLTIRANVNVAQAGAGIDFGTNLDPIPQGVTTEFVINASATPTGNKYNISSPGGVNGVFFRFCGAPKTRNAFLTAPVSAGATSIQVTDASGWVIGDSLFLEQPINDVLQTQTVTITSISGTTIGVSAITFARVSGLAVSNINCNVLLRSQTSTAASTNYFRCSTSPSATGIVEVRNCEIRDIGYLYLDYPSSNNVVVANTPTFDSCYVSGTSSSRSMIGGIFGTYEMAFSNNILIGGTSYSQQNLLDPQLSFSTVTNSVFYMLGTTAFSGAFGYNATWGLNVTSCRFNGYWGCVTQATAGLQTFTNCRFRSKFNEPYSGGQANIQFNNCDFLTQSGAKYIKLTFNAAGSVNIQNPTVDDVTKLNPNANYNTMKVNAYSINGIFNANRSYTYNCLAINQNAIVNRASNNIALQLNNSQTSGQYTFSFQGVTGVAQRIIGYLRHDTTYGTSNPPSISFSGAGVSGSFVSGSAVNVWEKFDITLTPTSVGTITATVSFAGATGGTAYLDGVYQFPFITDNWIYGFQKLAQVNSVVDSNITLSESAVAALTSCATLDNVYDSATYWSVTNFTSSGYTIVMVDNGTQIDFGTNTVAINNGAPSNFAFSGTTATIKSALLTSGAKFKSLKAAFFNLLSPVTNLTLTGDASQPTPTNLTDVVIEGNLTYNTNTPITVTLTNCSISGTISNLGTGLVTVNLGNTTIGTTGANVATRPVTSINIIGLTAGSQIYIENGAGDQVVYVASSGTSYTLDTTGQTGIWAVKVARFGYLSQKGAHSPAVASTNFLVNLPVDPFITETAKAIVAAYVTVENNDKLFDYSAFYETTNEGIVYDRIITKAGTAASAGSYNVTLNDSGSVWGFDGTDLVINSTSTLAGGTTISGALFTSGYVRLTTAQTNTSITANVLQDTPTDLEGMVITGNLNYNDDADIDVTFTDCVVTGTISNDGAGNVKVFRAGTSGWFTEGTNVLVRANVSITTSDNLALTTAVLQNGSIDLGWIPEETARVLEVAQGDTFSIYAIAYGYQASLFSATADDFTTFRIALIPEIYIDTTLDTTTRDVIVSKFSSYRDDNNRFPLTINEDLRNYSTAEILNALQYYIVTQGYWFGTAVIFGAPINGFTFIQGGVYIADSNYYFKVNDSVTTPTNLGYLLPIVIGVDENVYIAYAEYSPVEMNTSDIVMQYAPWTHITAEISSADKADISDQSSTKVWLNEPERLKNVSTVQTTGDQLIAFQP